LVADRHNFLDEKAGNKLDAIAECLYAGIEEQVVFRER